MECETNKCNLLEQMLLDANKEPTALPLSLLEAITNKFSEDHKIGSGGFAVVYEGLLQNGSVAVKRLSQEVDMDEKNFSQEVFSLTRVKHKNIVRFLGYCADTQGKVEKYAGKMVIADIRQRLLCFEFLPNGGLDRYINGDASQGLEWKTRYGIIKGICVGLHYLHQLNIVHVDLKPSNILLDSNMVPKIADFGLSKCFSENQTRAVTSRVFGSLGYMAPEFYSGVITFKSDIYSLGIIIMEILTGQKGYLPIENVLERWSTRFQTSQGGIWLEHVRVCAEIGFQCMDSDPMKRPTTAYIVEKLDELEGTYGFIEMHDKLERAYGFIEPDLSATHIIKVVDVHPLELRFPWEANRCIKCPVTLSNMTDHHVGVWITPSCPDASSSPTRSPYLWESQVPSWGKKELGLTLFRGLMPHSSMIIYMTMKEQQQQLPPQADMGMFEVVMLATKSKEALGDLGNDWTYGIKIFESEDPFKTIKELGTELHRATLRAITCDPVLMIHQQFLRMPSSWKSVVLSIDVHPTEKWVLMGHAAYHSIWNYNTHERVMIFESLRDALSIKFINREQWIAIGTHEGSVHVYSYTTKDMVTEFRAHHCIAVSCLAVHPTDTLLLTASRYSETIKLWDWGQGWALTRIFHMYEDNLGHLTFGPTGTNTFAASACSRNVVKVWDIDSLDPIATFEGWNPTFCTDSHRHFLVTTHHGVNDNVTIWDLQARKRLHALGHHHCSERVACHPTLPILATFSEPAGTSSKTKHIFLWDVRTYRLKKKVDFSMTGSFVCMVFDGAQDLTRLLVAGDDGISIIKINVPMLLNGGGI